MGIESGNAAQSRTGTRMRELDAEETELLGILDDGVPTLALIGMVRDLSEVLQRRGYVIQARVAEVAADRLQLLGAGPKA
jgi:hypothetical protein